MPFSNVLYPSKLLKIGIAVAILFMIWLFVVLLGDNEEEDIVDDGFTAESTGNVRPRVDLTVEDSDYTRGLQSSDYAFDLSVSCYYFVQLSPLECLDLIQSDKDGLYKSYSDLLPDERVEARNRYIAYLRTLSDDEIAQIESGGYSSVLGGFNNRSGSFYVGSDRLSDGVSDDTLTLRDGGDGSDGLSVRDGASSNDSALSSSISFSGRADTGGSGSRQGDGIDTSSQDALLAAYLESAGNIPGANPYAQQNNQQAKRDFINRNSFSVDDPNNAFSLYDRSTTITAGTVIPIKLETELNSDVPGYAYARISNDVLSSDFSNILFPVGSQVIGVYDSEISFNQSRLVVSWQQVNRPDGVTVYLGGLLGADSLGRSGFSDLVDYHVDDILASASVLSAFSLAYNTADRAIGLIPNFGSEDGDSDAADPTLDAFSRIFISATENSLNRQPTIVVRSGYEGTILVHQNLTVPPYRSRLGGASFSRRGSRFR